jgi:CRP-like cAMP-binding protein
MLRSTEATGDTRGPETASLLDLVPELGDGIPEQDRRAARRGTAVLTVRVPPGPWSPSPLVEESGAVGFLLTEGAIVRDVLMAGSIASDLLGPGDVAGLGDNDAALVPVELRWTASAPSRVAVLDPSLLTALEAWPAVTARLLARATRQTSTLAALRAISQLPRVDQRLLALFWHLAEHWGRVGRDGIIVRLALTHETLGRMVGARRPTVSLALKELAATGTVVRRLDGAWVLRREGLERLAAEPAGSRWQPPDATVLPDLGAAARPSPPPEPIGVRSDDLRDRLRLLDGSHAEQERRVREVLERCAETREQLTQSRRRREATTARRPTEGRR